MYIYKYRLCTYNLYLFSSDFGYVIIVLLLLLKYCIIVAKRRCFHLVHHLSPAAAEARTRTRMTTIIHQNWMIGPDQSLDDHERARTHTPTTHTPATLSLALSRRFWQKQQWRRHDRASLNCHGRSIHVSGKRNCVWFFLSSLRPPRLVINH